MIVTRSAAYLRMAERIRCSVAASIAAVESSNTITAGLQHQCAGDRQALPLAAGQRNAALADDGVVTGRQAKHIVVQLGAFAGAGDPALLCPRVAIGNVVFDRGREQKRILLHDRHGAAQRLQCRLANILSVDGDAAAGHIVETRDQVGERRFPAAGGPTMPIVSPRLASKETLLSACCLACSDS
jgi:hypothetical protein